MDELDYSIIAFETGPDSLLDSEIVEAAWRSIAQSWGVMLPAAPIRHDSSMSPTSANLVLHSVVRESFELDAADPSSQISELLIAHIHELVDRQSLTSILNMVRHDHPVVIDELIPDLLSLGQLLQVIQGLLREGVAIKAMPLILGTLADNARYTKDPAPLTEHVRVALGHQICAQHLSTDGDIKAFTLSHNLERTIQNSVQLNESGPVLMLDPNTSQSMMTSLQEGIDEFPSMTGKPLIVVAPKIRRHVAALIKRRYPAAIVLSYNEIVPSITVQNLFTIGDSFSSSVKTETYSDQPAQAESTFLIADDEGETIVTVN